MKVSYNKPHLTYQQQRIKLEQQGILSGLSFRNRTHRLLALLAEYPTIQTRHMGFPQSWRNHPIWSQA